MKIVLSGLTMASVAAALIGVTARPSAALPVMQPQTAATVAYYHHHHYYRHHHHHHGGGINIHL